MKSFPFYKQLDHKDCGPTCLRIILRHYGKHYSAQTLRELSHVNRGGTSIQGLSDAAEKLGFRTLSVQLTFDKLFANAPMPFVVHWRKKHFVVVYGYKKGKVYVADPAIGKLKYSKEEFLQQWASTRKNNADVGIAFLLEPSPELYLQGEEKRSTIRDLRFFLSYLKPHRRLIIQILLGLLGGSLLQLIAPFLTQSVVDIGINTNDIGFIYLVLAAQLMLFVGSTTGSALQAWMFLQMGTRINISLLTDFLIKLTRLPIAYFDTKVIGDTIQRIQDNKRIERLLTASTLSTLFSMVNLIILSFVLAIYDGRIFVIFISGSVLYAVWVILFLKKRREIDYRQFDQFSREHSSLIQLIQGMQEIKLNGIERKKRWEWEKIQANLFKVKISGLRVEQVQQIGSGFINQLKNILVTFVSAKAVISGDITLGMMLAIQYIIGQLNGPIDQLVGFIRTLQDAKIGLERLSEVYRMEDEEPVDQHYQVSFPAHRTLTLDQVSFQYGDPKSEKVLNGVDLEIPEGKITAIVGTSGSGKTTLIKLLLKFYAPKEGRVKLGHAPFDAFSSRWWRSNCGVVLQDSYIFSDTIAGNISASETGVDHEKLLHAAKTANIQDFIESLPLGYDTKIGDDGHGLSQGQKQRILIARAVYKNPAYLFLDEATNSLDANNEKTIMENLNNFFQGRTVVVVAHRLSTVKHADQIVVLDKGKIIEQGDHQTLTQAKGAYFNLVKNQLELGN